MFPLEYPLRVLKGHRKDMPIIMDPFCGRGTTLFAARQLGLAALGIDSSPVAIAIAQSKLCRVNVNKTLKIAKSYIETDLTGKMPTSEFFQHAFSPSVLKQICAIREGLLGVDDETDTTVLLRAAMLGCLHGERSKRTETQSYFSNQMPRTFATKPGYSVRYWKDKGLIPPNIDVINVLSRKLSRIKSSDILASVSHTDARLGDSRLPDSLPINSCNFSLVITSPPYYGMKTYVEDQWLRNWFLGGPDHVQQYCDVEQLPHKGKDVFAESLGSVWKNMARTNADSLHMYIRFGIIPSAKLDPKELVRNSLESSGIKWRVVSTRKAATASSGRRQADYMLVNSVAATEYDFHVMRV
jgi:hypothetical protein